MSEPSRCRHPRGNADLGGTGGDLRAPQQNVGLGDQFAVPSALARFLLGIAGYWKGPGAVTLDDADLAGLAELITGAAAHQLGQQREDAAEYLATKIVGGHGRSSNWTLPTTQTLRCALGRQPSSSTRYRNAAAPIAALPVRDSLAGRGRGGSPASRGLVAGRRCVRQFVPATELARGRVEALGTFVERAAGTRAWPGISSLGCAGLCTGDTLGSATGCRNGSATWTGRQTRRTSKRTWRATRASFSDWLNARELPGMMQPPYLTGCSLCTQDHDPLGMLLREGSASSPGLARRRQTACGTMQDIWRRA